MNARKTLTMLLAICLILISYNSFTQTAEELLPKAIQLEEVNGELEKAIEVYQKIILDFPEKKSIAAKAQFHIGLCYEKLGLKEALKAYRAVVNNYPDQQNEVALAQERLNRLIALQEIPHKPEFRKIRIPTKPDNGVLSPDGKHMAFTSQGSVWIVPLQGKVQPDLAGEPYRLTEPMEATNYGNTIAWSYNGEWIAFNAVEDDKETIYVIPVAGGIPKKIPIEIKRKGGGGMHDHRLSLSPDGSMLAFSSSDIHSLNTDPHIRPQSIFLASVKDGSVKRLTEEYTEQPAFSPDGNKIVYVKRYKSEGYKDFYEGWVIPTAGGTPIQITDSSDHVTGPVWSPDGKMIAFNSRMDPERDNINQVLIVSIGEDGRPLGSPDVIKLPQITFLIPAGWTQSNKIGLQMVNPRYQAIYTVPFPGGKATQVTPDGWGNNPCWSMDGEKILFRWTDRFASIPATGGEMSTIPVSSDEKTYMALPGGGNHLSPDGKTIVFAGAKMNYIGVDIISIPVEGGEPVSITKSPTQDRFPCWSPDGKNIAFIRYHTNSDGIIVMNIYVISSNGGEERQITSDNDNVDWSSIKFLPDGNHIAYFSKDNSIKMIPIEGGESM